MSVEETLYNYGVYTLLVLSSLLLLMTIAYFVAKIPAFIKLIKVEFSNNWMKRKQREAYRETPVLPKPITTKVKMEPFDSGLRIEDLKRIDKEIKSKES